MFSNFKGFASTTDTLDFSISSLDLTDEEKSGLIYMVEEEKLARDVYHFLFEKWGSFQFENIGESEQRHLNLLVSKINEYGLINPVSESYGIFKNPNIKKLYDELTYRGSYSEADAFEVGATIEDLDIFDINHYQSITANPEINSIYEKLKCGSGNHLRAFTYKLKQLDLDYKNTYLDDSIYKNIVNSEHQRCGCMK